MIDLHDAWHRAYTRWHAHRSAGHRHRAAAWGGVADAIMRAGVRRGWGARP